MIGLLLDIMLYSGRLAPAPLASGTAPLPATAKARTGATAEQVGGAPSRGAVSGEPGRPRLTLPATTRPRQEAGVRA